MLIRLAPGLFVLLWSSGFIGAKLGLPHADAFSFLLVRFVLAGGLMAALALAARAHWPRSPRTLGRVALAGLLVHAAYLGGVFYAIDQGLGAAVTALLVGLQPILTGVAAGPFLGERVTARQYLGLVLAMAGLTLVVWDPSGEAYAHLPPAGLLAAMVSLLAITLGTLYQKRHGGGVDSRAATAVQYGASAVAMAVLVAARGGLDIQWTGQFVFALAWLTLVLSVGAVTLLYFLLRQGAAVGVANLFNLAPPATAVLAALVFDEPLTLADGAGFALTALGVWLARP